MAFEGNLETMSVADLLQWAANGRQTGTIRISRTEVTKMIYIEAGVIVSCTSTDPREFLGHFLVSHGAIGEKTLHDAVIEQERTSELFGQVLIERGKITRETLNTMLRLKAEEAIFDLFTWSAGRFLFIEGELPSHELVPISLDVQGLVLEGMRRLDEWQRIRELIPSPLAVPVAVAPLIGDEAESGDESDPGRRTVLEAVDDDRSIEEICLHTHSSEFFVFEILFHEARAGRVKIVRPRVVERESTLAEGLNGDALVELATEHLASGKLERCVRHLRASSSLEPHNRELAERIREVEDEVRSKMADEGVVASAVPALAIDGAELATLDLQPSEGFILSRVDGVSAIEAIVKISPLPEIEALLVIWRLAAGGQLQLG